MTLKKNFERDEDVVRHPSVSTIDLPEVCQECHGEGYIAVGPKQYHDCPVCNGEGIVYKLGRCHV